MAVKAFASTHIPQITATAGLVTFALAKHKLTPGGIVAAILTAFVHMLHPWPVFFWLLVTFFLGGVVVTKVGHARKAHLTQSSTGSTGGEGARNWVQVLANSLGASVLILIHAWLLRNSTPFISSIVPGTSAGPYLPALEKTLPVGIMAYYAAAAADTFSSELGILSTATPFMVTAPWKKVPRGTNGGVTTDGLSAGALGGWLIAMVATYGVSALPPHRELSFWLPGFVTIAGLFGSILDSVLGALLQETVTDQGTGKVVEGVSGKRVAILEGGTRIKVGNNLLSNNGVNFAMAIGTSLFAMLAFHLGGFQI
ncbi:hypothetical protein K431DRAFT_282461 [Polychaeton citri CBS 116435]|uniref:DUF92-domain-containing protein n=1 Tax=Polychaeton citri CBS 116435 TaxID=1314669 RepID=A0A9P4QAS8_9PEZI|nr:hypothetical protein K431DRAFT_282461 [Polychaeton citri CBS 116435]